MKCFKQKTFSIILQMSYVHVVIQSKLLNVLQFKRKYININEKQQKNFEELTLKEYSCLDFDFLKIIQRFA